MSSLTSGFGDGMFGGSSGSSVSSVSEDQLLAAAKSSDPNATGSTSVGEIDPGCPSFIVAPHDSRRYGYCRRARATEDACQWIDGRFSGFAIDQ
jgi:hypothetical protein